MFMPDGFTSKFEYHYTSIIFYYGFVPPPEKQKQQKT